jgi:hypothetical protein
MVWHALDHISLRHTWKSGKGCSSIHEDIGFIMNEDVSAFCTCYILQLEKDWIAENDIRYTPFDPEELARVACDVMNARNCTLIEKLEEGMSFFSRVGLPRWFLNPVQGLTTKLFA